MVIGRFSRSNRGRQTERLQLAAPVILKRRLQHARHFEGRGGHASDRQQRCRVEFEDFIDAVGDNDISGRGAAVAPH